MLTNLASLFPLFMLLPASQSVLFQVNRSRTLCDGEEAVFICSNNDGPVIRILVTALTGSQVNLNLQTSFKHADEKILDSTVVVRVVITLNNSLLYRSKITLRPPVSCTIQCNTDTITYQLQNYSSYLPSNLTLHSQGNSNLYNITWMPEFSSISSYLVTVNSRPLNETIQQLSISQSLALNLTGSIFYTIMIFFQDCSHLYNTTFKLDCPLSLPTSIQSISYAKSSSGNFSAQVKCRSSEDNIVLFCNDGTWTNPSETDCSTDNPYVPEDKLVVAKTRSLTAAIISTECATEKCVNSTDINLVLILAITTLFICLLCLLLGILLGLIVGMKSKIKIFADTNTQISADIVAEQPNVMPLYEDIGRNQNLDTIELSENVSYGQLS